MLVKAPSRVFKFYSGFSYPYGADNRQSQRDVENLGLIEKLVCGTSKCNSVGRPAESSIPQRRYPAFTAVRAALHSSHGQTSRKNCHE